MRSEIMSNSDCEIDWIKFIVTLEKRSTEAARLEMIEVSFALTAIANALAHALKPKGEK